jgi:hypothetical protein
MSYPTSKWFETLTQRERKQIVCMLFDLKSLAQVQRYAQFSLFLDLVRMLDDEYHSLK